MTESGAAIRACCSNGDVSTPPAQHRVLVVDDEHNIVNLLTTALRFVGFDVVSATNGRQALEQAVATSPDVIVLDVMLPDLDGFGVCTRLREAGIDAPVLFLTARDASEDKVHGLTLGGDDYVTKPFDLDELVARLNVLLAPPHGAGREQPGCAVGDLELDEDTRRGAARRRVGAADRRPSSSCCATSCARPPRAVQGADPRPGLGLRLRRRLQRCRDLLYYLRRKLDDRTTR